jgi:DNA (cytosine-5)-methyltransferase 1
MNVPAHALEAQRLAEQFRGQGDQPEPMFDVHGDGFDCDIAGLFEGYGGLTMGVQAAVGGELGWYSEIEPAACKVLAHHHPGVPNLGDVTAVDWAAVPRPRILTGGFPCQDVSSAGRRRGLRADTRSGLWTHMAAAIDALRPELVVIENVRGLLSADAHCDVELCPWCLGDDEGRPLRALGAVLGDLADLGYDARWGGLRAADVGAPHGRYRVFIVAAPAADTESERRAAPGDPGSQPRSDAAPVSPADLPAAHAGRSGLGPDQRDLRSGESDAGRRTVAHSQGDGRHEGRSEPVRDAGWAEFAGGDGDAPADADGLGPVWSRGARGRRGGPTHDDLPAAHAHRDGREGWERGPAAPAGRGRRPAAAHHATASDADGHGLEGCAERDLGSEAGQSAPLGGDAAGRLLDWGDYAPAIRRWELILGRPAPAPTMIGARGGHQLSPSFVEWMMGLPPGHVTAVPEISRNDQLKMLGNGVCPQQAAAALQWLLASAADKAAA